MGSRIRLCLSVMAAFLLGLPAAGFAQGMMGARSTGAFEVHGGMAIPTGSLSHFEKIGPSAGLSFAYQIVPRVAVRARGDVEFLRGKDLILATPTASGLQTAPNLTLWHYNAGVEVTLTNPEPDATPWNVLFDVGIGATSMKSATFALTDGVTSFSKTYLSPTFGLTVGYDVSSNVSIFAGGQGYLTFVKRDDTMVFQDLTAGQVGTFSTQFSAPVFAGFRVRF